MSKKELAEELLQPIIKKFKKSPLKFYRQYLGCWPWWYNIIPSELFLWVIPLEDKKGITITMLFRKF